MILVLSLAAALSGQTTPSATASAAPPVPPPPPRIQRDVRVIHLDGVEGEVGARGPMPAPGLARLDKDGDGFISREEYAAPTNAAFRVLDGNSDGRISGEELAEGRRTARIILGESGLAGHGELRLMGRPGGTIVGGAPMGPDGPEGQNGPEGPNGPRIMIQREGPDGGPPTTLRLGEGGRPEDLDTDKDGKVSEAEFTAPLRDAFRAMDRDHSGSLEAGEQGGNNAVHVFTRRVERPAT